MYRLKFRKSLAGIGALLLGAVMILGVPFNPTTAGLIFDLIGWPFLVAQLLIPFFFALFTYRACPFIQQMRAFLVTSSFIGFFGVLANSNPVTAFQIIQQDWLLHFNAVAFGIMNLASFIAATNLMASEQMSSFADTQVAEAQLERLKAVKVDPDTQAKWEKAAAYADRSADGRSLRSTMTNLKAISLAEPGQELKPQMREEKPKAGRSDSHSATEEGSLSSLLDRMDDEPLPGQELSDSGITSALAGNSFINDVNDSLVEVADPFKGGSSAEAESTSAFDDNFVDKFAQPEETAKPEAGEGSFLDSILDARMAEEEPAASSEAASNFELPAEDPEVTNVGALLDSFEELPGTMPEATVAEEEDLSAAFAALAEKEKPEAEAPPAETTRTTSFASASSSRIPAMQPPTDTTDTSATPEVASVATPAPQVTASAPSVNSPSAFTTSTPGNTNNKLAAMKRRNTSTFTKLNALSASGSGPLMPTAPAAAESEPDSLRSLLDRLDDDAPAAETAVKEVEAPKPIEPPVELTIDTVFKGDGVPEVAATPTAVAQPRAAAPATVAEPAPEPVVEETPAVEAAPEETPEDEESEGDGDGENVFGDSEAVNLDVDRAFEELAPPEAQLDVSARATRTDTADGGAEEADSTAEGDEDGQSNLFEGGVDSEIDDIFTELAPPEAQKEVKDVLVKKEVEPASPAAAEGSAEAEDSEDGEEGGLFGEDLGEELDKVFSDLTEEKQLDVNAATLAKVKGETAPEPVAAAAAPAPEKVEKAPAPAPAAEKVAEAASAAASTTAAAKPAPAKFKEVKEFGRLSSKSPAAKTGGETGGTMKTIGKLLLDVQAVENIIKSGENRKIGANLSTAKIISQARGEGIKNILTAIDTYEGVAGSLIVGHDGLVIASTVTGWDKDMLGALSTALLSTSNLATKKLEIGKLRQMVMMTEFNNNDGHSFKTTVLTDVDVGILAVFLEKTDVEKIDGLLETIQNTIHGG